MKFLCLSVVLALVALVPGHASATSHRPADSSGTPAAVELDSSTIHFVNETNYLVKVTIDGVELDCAEQKGLSSICSKK
jgi:hypothetical protein